MAVIMPKLRAHGKPVIMRAYLVALIEVFSAELEKLDGDEC